MSRDCDEGNGRAAEVISMLADIKADVKYIRNGMDLQNVNLANAMNNLSTQIKLMVDVNSRSIPVKLVLVIFALVFGLVFGIELLQAMLKGGLVSSLFGFGG